LKISSSRGNPNAFKLDQGSNILKFIANFAFDKLIIELSAVTSKQGDIYILLKLS
jgi:hypothetical protein